MAALLIIQKGETRHFRKESACFERLYREGEAGRARLMADYAAVAATARAEDQANAVRVANAQSAINRSSLDDYKARVADARARFKRLRSPDAAQGRGSGRDAAVPALSAASIGAHEAAGQNRLPSEDALVATEQAIQLDELIKWIRAQSAIDPNENRAHSSD